MGLLTRCRKRHGVWDEKDACASRGLHGDDLKRLARASRDANQTRRLLVLAVIYDGGSQVEAAETDGVALQIGRDWVERFNGQGPDSLIYRKAPGSPSKLGHAQRAELPRLFERGPIPGLLPV